MAVNPFRFTKRSQDKQEKSDRVWSFKNIFYCNLWILTPLFFCGLFWAFLGINRRRLDKKIWLTRRYSLTISRHGEFGHE
jgi:hypothetical protein